MLPLNHNLKVFNITLKISNFSSLKNLAKKKKKKKKEYCAQLPNQVSNFDRNMRFRVKRANVRYLYKA